MPKMTKIDLTLLKRLVNELEGSLNSAELIKSDKDLHDYVIEMSKAAGLAAGVMTEAGLLVGDIGGMVQNVQSPTSDKDNLSKILGALKGGGGLPGSN